VVGIGGGREVGRRHLSGVVLVDTSSAGRREVERWRPGGGAIWNMKVGLLGPFNVEKRWRMIAMRRKEEQWEKINFERLNKFNYGPIVKGICAYYPRERISIRWRSWWWRLRVASSYVLVGGVTH
jgi:hypothetical protein